MEEIDEAAALAQATLDKESAESPLVRKMVDIVRQFIETHRVMCYGGTAINNLLPPEDQFYDFTKEVPDYDFYSEKPQLHGAKLADRLTNAGFSSVEVKPGVHLGTFKVFADYIPIADISHLDTSIFKKLWEHKITKDKVHYVPPNFLRMSVYLELSRPRGDVSRWKKVHKRLALLNKHYPIQCHNSEKVTNEYVSSEVRRDIRKVLEDEKLVLLGFNGAIVQEKTPYRWLLPLDLLTTPEKRPKVAQILVDVFRKHENVRAREFPKFEELFPARTDIVDSKTGDVLVRIYDTDACHSYHNTPSGLRVASIPTLLQFFLAALYAPAEFREHKPEEQFLCTAEHLINLANSSSRKYKLLTPITCLGTQPTLQSMRAERSEVYKKLSQNPQSRKFLSLFFTYTPTDLTKTQRQQKRRAIRRTFKIKPF
jgi:hypothetical protein